MAVAHAPRLRRQAKIFALLLTLYGGLLLPGLFWTKYLDYGPGLLAVFPFLSVYLFHLAGIPWLLKNNGRCGWGWCDPTLFGWIFLLAFWLTLFWLLAGLIERWSRPAVDKIDDRKP